MTNVVCQELQIQQRDADRLRYGSRLLAQASRRLRETGIKGCSTSRLKPYRQLYQQHRAIGPTVSDQFVASEVEGQPRDIQEELSGRRKGATDG